MRRLLGVLIFWHLTASCPAEAVEGLHLDPRLELELGQTDKWRASRVVRDDRVRLEFQVNKKKFVSFKPLVPSAQIERSEVWSWKGRDYLVTIWRDGTSATSVRVFDPLHEKQILVWSKESAGDVEIKHTAVGIMVEYFEIQAGVREPRAATSEWKAGT